MVPSSSLVFAKANVLPASWYNNEVLALLVALPFPLVNTIPKSVAVPVLPSPILINLSWTTWVVVLVWVNWPITLRLPWIVVLPLTVKLSPTVTSDVEWPIFTGLPEWVVEIFNAPVEVLINESVPLWEIVKSSDDPTLIALLSLKLISVALNLPVTLTCLLDGVLLPVTSIIVSLNVPCDEWSLANLNPPNWDINW